MKNVFEVWKNTRSVSAVFDASIEQYEGEIKGYQIMIRREELSEHSPHIKQQNINGLKKQLRQAKYNLTRVRNLKK